MENLLIFYSVLSGFLAFFEPCTIATHTLFSVHTASKNKSEKHKIIALFLLSRLALVLIVLYLFFALFDRPHWNILTVRIILSVIAILYLLSRFSYLPIPHFDLSKLLPGKLSKNQAIQLGLTLPACTVPLFIVLVGLNITVHNFMFTTFSGILFAFAFSLPTILTIYIKITHKTKQFLNVSATSSPFVTSFLFLLAVIFV